MPLKLASRKSKRARFARSLSCQPLENRIVLAAGVGDDNFSVGDELRNYRVAIAATAEYTAILGGQTQALSAIQTMVAGLNEIFEEELSIHFDLVSGTNTIFTDAGTDGYTNGNTNQMLNANTAILDGIIGNGNYDIGHVLGTTGSGGSGLGGLGVVNNVTRKGEGASVSSDPQGAGFLNLVAHEFGHQFGAEHTFNANAFGSTAGTAYEASSAYEPASGSTLMSYAGIADDINGNDNLQDSPDNYFHAASFEQITEFVNGTGSASSTTSVSNNIPTIVSSAPFTIPAGTPFELDSTGSDADATDTLTYTWEQLDLGNAQSLPISDNGSAPPLFRSFVPSTESNRVFPRLSDLVAGVNTAAIGEALPTTNRDLNFRTTVRDGNGGINSDDVMITVVDTGTPFAVTSTGSTNWTGGVTETIAWDVGGTTGNGINVANVGIDLSIDGGLTYPITLSNSTLNDGSFTFTVPNIDVAEARVRVKGIGNVFFDISDVNFAIAADPGAPGITVTEAAGGTITEEDGVVAGAGIATYDIGRNTATAGTTEVQVDADGQTEVSTDGINFASSVTVNLTGTTNQTIHVRGIDDTVQEGIHSGLISHSVISSTDANYSTSTIVSPLSVTIADDELQPVVGVDLDMSGGSSPTNWTTASATFGDSYTSLIREDGITTGINLNVGIGGAAGLNSSAPNDVPFHSPPLNNLDGVHLADSLTLTWTGLTPGTDYNLYVLATENFAGSMVQEVTIIGGAGNPLPFTQNSAAAGNELFVNAGIADSSKTLEADAVIAQADPSGQISISVIDTSGTGDGIFIAGAAIQQVGPDTIGFGVTQTDGLTEVAESGTADTFDVVLKSQPTDTVVIDVASSDTGEATVDKATLTFDATNWNVPQTVTVQGVDDAIEDGTQTSVVTLSIDVTQTLDNEFDSVSDRGLTVLTLDNDAIPLIGVDFDDSGSAPTNWTSVTDTFGSTTSNLVDEAGVATIVDLQVAIGGGAVVTNSSSPSNLPNHTPSLADLGGERFATNTITLTWSDLTPDAEYDLWVFATRIFGNQGDATVTVTGGAPAPFTMDVEAAGFGTLVVNDAVASSANTLKTDAVRATADGSGQIQIVVSNTGGEQLIGLNGAAIQEVPPTPVDFGDAPTDAQSGFANSYPVTLADDGARHGATGPRLGAQRDVEADGLATADADGDDLNATDDEDGVQFGLIQANGTIAAANVMLENATTAQLDAWIDFNRNGIWEASEQIFDDFTITNTVQTLNYTLPAGVTEGDTYARVRVSTAGNLDPTGEAPDGEVEDYKITIRSASPIVESIVLNNGDAQRSSIESATLTFDRVVQLTGDPFQFNNITDSQPFVDTSVVTEVDGKTVVDFTFPTPLTDGDYELVVDATLVASLGAALDGNGDGTGGDNHVYVDDFYRKYGDYNGSGIVDLLDFSAFRQTFGKSAGETGYLAGFDANSDDTIGLLDFAQFRQNFGS